MILMHEMMLMIQMFLICTNTNDINISNDILNSLNDTDILNQIEDSADMKNSNDLNT